MTLTDVVPTLGFTGPDAPDPSVIASCVHCGLCLNECPTYRVLRVEMDSPRGRIQLTKAVDEGHIPLSSPAYLKHTFRCLDCRACETACPSGVQYGQIIEAVRAQTLKAGLLPVRRRVAQFVLKHVFTRPWRLRLAGSALRFYQRSSIDRLVRWSGLLRHVAPAVAEVQAMAPRMSGRFLQARDLRFVPADGETLHRVGFITGCIMALGMADTHRASIRVLARNGCEVHIPEHQRCCGSLHMHGGDRATARDLARRNIDAFESAGFDAVVINSAGCGSTLKEYPELLADDPEYADRAQAFAQTIRDFSEFLAEIGLRDSPGTLEQRVVYQDACHLIHGQGVSRQPRELLRQIPGLDLVEMARPTLCCGSAGLYSATDTQISLRILEEKLDDIQSTGASTLVTGNPGCYFHLIYGAQQRGLDLRVVHIADILDEAYTGSTG